MTDSSTPIDRSEPEAGSNPVAVPKSKDPQEKFNLIRVLVTLLALVVIGGIAAGAWHYYFQEREPVLYPVKGVVYLDGEPMSEGLVMTKYLENRRMVGGLTVIGKDGRFELKTNGEEGIYEGEHKILVVWTNNGFPPLSYIPEKYGKAAETPFSITVDKNTQNEEVKLELFGRKELPPRRMGGFRRPGAPEPSNENTPEENGESSEKNRELPENEK
jgi:hypothetical protein